MMFDTYIFYLTKKSLIHQNTKFIVYYVNFFPVHFQEKSNITIKRTMVCFRSAHRDSIVHVLPGLLLCVWNTANTSKTPDNQSINQLGKTIDPLSYIFDPV